MKVALVYDRVNKWGGAERVLLALHEIWPEAPLYTSVYDASRASWARDFDIRTSFLQHFPMAKRYHEFYPWLTPMAFESFSFEDYDVVLSVTSSEAKNVITKPTTLHICYCLTPTRFLWSSVTDYQHEPGLGVTDRIAKPIFKTLIPRLKQWDMIACQRPDYYLAISEHIAKRIETYYHRQVFDIIYPPFEDNNFILPVSEKTHRTNDPYYLVVSRLVSYKRLDIAIDACNELGVRLIIVGDGLLKDKLMARSGHTIQFITRHLTDRELANYYGYCRALIMPQNEDFGIVAVEAQAAGKPVISYRDSAVNEIVIDGKTGIFFDKQDKDSLKNAIQRFEKMNIRSEDCVRQSKKFGKKIFLDQMRMTVEELFKQYKP